MVRHGVLKLGRISAVVALVSSGGITDVHAHAMASEGGQPVMEAGMHSACSALESETSELSGSMVGHHRAHDPRHPVPGTSSGCTCMGPCLDGSAVTSPDLPVSVDLPSESDDVGATPAPKLLIRRDPTAYLSPLPNAPPLA